MTRPDARDKARGEIRYIADIVPARGGLLHAVCVRSTAVSARIRSIDIRQALEVPGVVGVYTANDLHARPYGRALRDIPVLADGVVRYAGERVAAVVATTRKAAEAGASLVVVDYEERPAVTTIEEALAPGAPWVHEEPWTYPGATITADDEPNLVFHEVVGDLADVEAALADSAYAIDATYRTQGQHQGYLEPQACIADYQSPDRVELWFSNKVPHRLRAMLGHSLGMAPEAFDVQPVAMGGDFGGKGAPGEAPLCIELSRLTGHPVKLVLRYNEELIAGNPRHPSRIRVRMGCDEEGRLTAVAMDVAMNTGAYGGCTPSVAGSSAAHFPSYRTPKFFVEYRRIYTNTVPRGFMRAPGEAQGIFALESALDELAHRAGIDPEEVRRRNLLSDGEPDALGHTWVENRGGEVLEAALAAFQPAVREPGLFYGRGVGIYSRSTPVATPTSLRLVPTATGGVCVEVPMPETGTGSHATMREIMADALGLPTSEIEVRQVSTDQLPSDQGVGGSRVTSTFSVIADVAAKAWRNRLRDEPVLVELEGSDAPSVGSYGVQVVEVAVDPETGELSVLSALSAVDVAHVVNPSGHQMQIDGGAVTGYGFACLEDLDEKDGHVWAANLGEYKLPSARDVPRLSTVIVPGSLGVGQANVKAIGELTTPPFSAAVANAVFAATGTRIRELPLTAERIYRALHEPG